MSAKPLFVVPQAPNLLSTETVMGHIQQTWCFYSESMRDHLPSGLLAVVFLEFSKCVLSAHCMLHSRSGAGERAKHELDVNPVLMIPAIWRGRWLLTKKLDSPFLIHSCERVTEEKSGRLGAYLIS